MVGQVLAMYLIGYAVIRFLLEFVRIDPTPVFWILRLPQWVSVAVFIIGAGLFMKIKPRISADQTR